MRKQFLKANTKKKASSRWGGGCAHPLHPPLDPPMPVVSSLQISKTQLCLLNSDSFLLYHALGLKSGV